MSEKKWFVMKEGQVVGPMDREQIEDEIKINFNSLIWGRGLTEWLTPVQWQQETQAVQKKIAELTAEAAWKFRLGSEEKGPMSYTELLSHLRKITRFEDLKIWSNSLKDWKSIYSLPAIADQLGITRRKHPRVPIMGTLSAEVDPPQKFRVISISQGGLGLNDAKTLQVGETFKAMFTSAHLPIVIHCQCEVVYSSARQVGLQFINLPAEFKGAIIEYVNKFEDLA